MGLFDRIASLFGGKANREGTEPRAASSSLSVEEPQDDRRRRPGRPEGRRREGEGRPGGNRRGGAGAGCWYILGSSGVA